MPGAGGGGALWEALSLSPTKAVLVPAVFAIGVVILAVYFLSASGTESVRLEDKQKQAPPAVTHEESSSVTASPVVKAMPPSPAVEAPRPAVKATRQAERQPAQW